MDRAATFEHARTSETLNTCFDAGRGGRVGVAGARAPLFFVAAGLLLGRPVQWSNLPLWVQLNTFEPTSTPPQHPATACNPSQINLEPTTHERHNLLLQQ